MWRMSGRRQMLFVLIYVICIAQHNVHGET
jgi:hypothetical protein